MVFKVQKWLLRSWKHASQNSTKSIWGCFWRKTAAKQTVSELAKNCTHTTILNHPHSMLGFVEKLEAWMSHELNKEKRLQIADQDLARHPATRGHKQCFFTESLREMRNGVYTSISSKEKSGWPQEIRRGLEPSEKKIICVWWDWKGMVHWKMLERNAIVDNEIYPSQLHRVNEVVWLKRPNHSASQQRLATCCTTRQNRTPRARMGSSLASTVPSRFYAMGLSLFPLHVESNEGCYLRRWREPQKTSSTTSLTPYGIGQIGRTNLVSNPI